MQRTRGALLVLIGFAGAVVACNGELSPAELGRRTYLGRCAQCHHPNPQLAGTLGPATAGSSRALIEARVLRATYPDGYTPQRNTQAMPAQPDLASEIDNLAAYLASVAPSGGGE